ncbi:hypothetical protein BC629DRAFT_1175167 [Irpex lacteus]|nr:hypothetical protein BC629DRAFT_1175167 [Irpex lacteus]
MTTAANIPPELFPLILDYIGTDDRGDGSLSERRDIGLRDWQACSLVCLYWANHCRRYMFYYLINNLHSKNQLDALRRLIAFEGSKRLNPLSSLVSRPTLRVQQTWDSRSWIHHIHPLPLKNTTCNLTLRGPVPQTFLYQPTARHTGAYHGQCLFNTPHTPTVKSKTSTSLRSAT